MIVTGQMAKIETVQQVAAQRSTLRAPSEHAMYLQCIYSKLLVEIVLCIKVVLTTEQRDPSSSLIRGS